jgi:4-diphosphocytidyl-2-C-methyl-D-erythritol kinase
MVRFPNCKINLGLHVTSKREDGYHNIETIFYPIALKDVLEIISSNTLNFQTTGLVINGRATDNLCLKAYKLLELDFPQLKPVNIHLHKAIPMGAGLGGGSSNGAYMLRMLNDKFDLQLSEDALINYALKLGSDCPFFILNKPCFATGRGEVLEPVDVDLSNHNLVLVNPGIHVSTADAFSTLTPQLPASSLKEVIRQPISTWRSTLFNDFEDSIFKAHPAIKQIKGELYNLGAVYASMTGTGSTVYGLFDNGYEPHVSFPDNYTTINIKATK